MISIIAELIDHKGARASSIESINQDWQVSVRSSDRDPRYSFHFYCL